TAALLTAPGGEAFEHSSLRQPLLAVINCGQLLTLAEAVEFFNVVLETRLTEGRKSDLFAFLWAREPSPSAPRTMPGWRCAASRQGRGPWGSALGDIRARSRLVS